MALMLTEVSLLQCLRKMLEFMLVNQVPERISKVLRPKTMKVLVWRVTVERRCERSRVQTVADSVEKPRNKKYARDNKASMERNYGVLGFNKKGFMIFHCPESEGGIEMVMSEIRKKVRTDFETSKFGGSGFGVNGATNEPHDGLIQKSHGLVDIVAQVPSISQGRLVHVIPTSIFSRHTSFFRIVDPDAEPVFQFIKMTTMEFIRQV
jgi:hypothetical protein